MAVAMAAARRSADTLKDSWPGRAQQIEQLIAIVGDGRVAAPPIMVYGGPSTGKTSIVRQGTTPV